MPKQNISKEDKALLKKSFWGTCACLRTTSSVVGQGRAMLLSTAPFIEKYYKNKEDRDEAILREASEYVNTNQAMFGLLAGVTDAMEKEKGEHGNLDTAVISGLKASLMGPLAGIGDSFIFNCLRVIIAGISISIASTGNIFGSILFAILYGGGTLAIRYWGLVEGYKNGTKLIDSAFNQGVIPLIMDACSTLGAIMIGALIATNVKVTIVAAPVIGGATVDIQGMLDSIMPGLLSLVLFAICMKALKKGMTPIKLIFTIMGACLLLSLLGIL